MEYVATITSKRQFTIPATLFKKTKLRKGQKVLVRERNGLLEIESMRKLVEKLAGSVPIAPEYRGLGVDEMIEKAKRDYFRNKR